MKLKSSLNYKTQYDSNKSGYILGIEMFPFFKREATAGAFLAPSIGTAGASLSGATPAVDLSASSNVSFNVAVDGGIPVEVLLDTTSLTSGPAIAVALETEINLALVAASQNGRVWVEFLGGKYNIVSQTTGAKSLVVITEGDGIAAELELGTALGTETVGTYSGDFAYVKEAGFNFSQDVEMSDHRSGRQASNFYKKKKMVEGDLSLYILLGNEGSNVTMSDAHKLIYESCFGRIVTDSATELTFDCAQPHGTYFSSLLCNNGLGQIVNGCYAKNWSLSLAGDSPASLTVSSKGRDSKMASVAKFASASTAVATVITVDKEAKRFEVGSVVMIVGDDGVTVSKGGLGNLTVVSIADATNTITLSEPVTTQVDGYLAPWSPAYFGAIPNDNLRIATDLEGSVSMDGGTSRIGEITGVEIGVENNLTDLDGYYGTDSNQGFIDGSRQEISVSLTLNLTVAEVRKIQLMKDFQTFDILIKVGSLTGQRMEIKVPRVIFNIPSIELPADGAVSLTFEGRALQTETGAMDAIKVSFKNA